VDKPRVVVIHTGGTLTMATSPGGDGTLSPSDEQQDLAVVPGLTSIAEIETQHLFNLDSGDMQPSHWIAIARAVHAAIARNDVRGVVVVHGTDTMSYSASALAFLLGPLPKPVVLTGAQRPLGDIRTDARSNLIDATIGATLAVPEVLVAFNAKLLRGCRTLKVDAWAFDAFASPGCAPLVDLGVGVSVASHVRTPSALRPLETALEPRVLAVRVFPGLDPKLVIGAARAGVRGLVLEAYGTGNLPHLEGSSLIPAIEECAERGVPMVIVSQCARGHVDLERYEGGAAAKWAGAIDGGDMTVEAAIAKLMIGLARFDDMEDLRNWMGDDVIGERTLAASPSIA
jgi:L-asparaginase